MDGKHLVRAQACRRSQHIIQTQQDFVERGRTSALFMEGAAAAEEDSDWLDEGLRTRLPEAAGGSTEGPEAEHSPVSCARCTGAARGACYTGSGS